MDTLYILKKDSPSMKDLNEVFDLMKKHKISFCLKNSDLIISIKGNDFVIKNIKDTITGETFHEFPPCTDYKLYYLGEIKV